MTEREKKTANIYEELERLKEKCLQLHEDSITYELCKILQDFILYTVSDNK